MVLKVIDQLLGATLANCIEIKRTRQLLPLKVKQFVECACLLPPLMSQLHTFAYALRIVTRTDHVFVHCGRLVHLVILISELESFPPLE